MSNVYGTLLTLLHVSLQSRTQEALFIVYRQTETGERQDLQDVIGSRTNLTSQIKVPIDSDQTCTVAYIIGRMKVKRLKSLEAITGLGSFLPQLIQICIAKILSSKDIRRIRTNHKF